MIAVTGSKGISSIVHNGCWKSNHGRFYYANAILNFKPSKTKYMKRYLYPFGGVKFESIAKKIHSTKSIHATFSTACISDSDPQLNKEIINVPTVTMNEDGSAIEITFAPRNDCQPDMSYIENKYENKSRSTSLFHAPWLWSNCPNLIHFTGARQRTPGQYIGTKIKNAQILPISNLPHHIRNNDDMFDESLPTIPIPSPPSDSCHPLTLNNYNNLSSVQSEMETNEKMLLCISWDDSFLDSYFDIDWLHRWRYDTQTLRERREQREVTKVQALRYGDNLTRISYKDLIGAEKDEAVFNLLDSIFTVGAAIVTNAPFCENDDSTPVKIIADEVAGSPSHGNLYGDIFHVKSEPYSKVNNIAYTSEPIGPHQDLAYYESMPGLQLLHCLEFGNEIIGGESTLIDAMAAAEELRCIAPHHFRTLVSCPVTFTKQRKDACMTYSRPHIVLQSSTTGLLSTSTPIHALDTEDDFWRSEIVTVNWSPPFEGPLSIPPEMIYPYYAAYSAFERMLDVTRSYSNNAAKEDEIVEQIQPRNCFSDYAKNYTWDYKLQPGEILVFNNRRLLHGRRGFHTGDSCKSNNEEALKRHFVGTYTNIDDTLNRYRALLREREGRDASLFSNVGNGSPMIP